MRSQEVNGSGPLDGENKSFWEIFKFGADQKW